MVCAVITLVLSIVATTAGPAPSPPIGSDATPRSDPSHLSYDFTITSPTAKIDVAVTGQPVDADHRIRLLHRYDGSDRWQDRGTFAAGQAIPITFDREGVHLIKLTPAAEVDENDPARSASRVYRCLVDWTSPVVHITSASCQNGKLRVRWLAYDPHLPTQSIEVYIVSDRGQTFIARCSNSGWGEFQCKPSLWPGRVKVTATDLAGNCAYALSKVHGTRKEAPSTQATTTQPTTQETSQTPPPPVDAINPKARWHFRIGTNYQAQGQPKLAEYHLSQAIQLEPKFVDAYVNLADVFINQRRYNEAAKSYLQALDLDVRNAAAWQGLGTARARLGQYHRAKPCFEKALVLDGDNGRAWLYLGDACWMLGQNEPAGRHWQHAQRLAHKQNRPDLLKAAEERHRLLDRPTNTKVK